MQSSDKYIVIALSQPVVAEDWRDAILAWDASVKVLIVNPRDPQPLPAGVALLAAITGLDTDLLDRTGTFDALTRSNGWLIRMADDDEDMIADSTLVRHLPLMVPVTTERMTAALDRIAAAKENEK
jgi:hypothetical protein